MLKKIGIGAVVLFALIGIIGDQEDSSLSPRSPDPAVSEYRTAISTQADDVHNSMTRLSEVAEDPRYLDLEWQLKLSSVLVLWSSTYSHAQDLIPPPGYETFHTKYVEALAKLNATADDIAVAVDNRDQERLNAAAAKLGEFTQLLKEAKALMPPA